MPSRLNTPKDILQFMGMVNFYRQYIHQISTKAEPLFRLLKKDNLPPPGQRLPWGEEQQQAYDEPMVFIRLVTMMRRHPVRGRRGRRSE